MHSHPHEPADPKASALPPARALVHYPARYSRTFPSVRAALASFGCVGAEAELHLANAAAEASPLIAVPVKPRGAGDALPAYVALVRRKPGGRTELLIGCPDLASDTEAEAHAVAAQLADAIPGRWCVVAWSRQTRAVQ